MALTKSAHLHKMLFENDGSIKVIATQPGARRIGSLEWHESGHGKYPRMAIVQSDSMLELASRLGGKIGRWQKRPVIIVTASPYSRPIDINLSTGNDKIGNVLNWSLPPVMSCMTGAPCKADCYARKAYRCYNGATVAWTYNLLALLDDFDATMDKIAESVADYAGRLVRIHVSGDFAIGTMAQNQAYVDRWLDIARQNPGKRFLAFTKCYNLDYSRAPENVSIVFSAWPGYELPAELPAGVAGIAYMQDGTESRIPAGAIECHGNCESCGMCWSLARIGGAVFFIKH